MGIGDIMPLEIGKRYRIKNKVVDIQRSDRKGKQKKAVLSDGTAIHFGDTGSTIAPGTERGNNYCARSSGIESSKSLSANDLARADWHCQGKTSRDNGPKPL